MFNMKFVVTVLFYFIFSAQAYAITPDNILNTDRDTVTFSSQIKNLMERLSLGLGFGLDARYQIGGEWGKKPVADQDLLSDAHFARMAFATARVRGGGTGFYIGRYGDQYVLATNHHVCPSAEDCSQPNAINFTLLGVRADVVDFYGSWPEIDLALFSIRFKSEADAAKIEPYASPFNFQSELKRGERLVTIGHGVANNPGGVLVANRDSDCIVFSGDGEYRLMADPDDLNPGPYKAWSFANGCDVSHGDSGSAMMNRDTGEVVGIIWTGRIPKDPKVQSSEYLNSLLAEPNEDIWNQLSYGVPASHMQQYLLEALSRNEIAPEHQAVLVDILN